MRRKNFYAKVETWGTLLDFKVFLIEVKNYIFSGPKPIKNLIEASIRHKINFLHRSNRNLHQNNPRSQFKRKEFLIAWRNLARTRKTIKSQTVEIIVKVIVEVTAKVAERLVIVTMNYQLW